MVVEILGENLIKEKSICGTESSLGFFFLTLEELEHKIENTS